MSMSKKRYANFYIKLRAKIKKIFDEK